jgi:hypothetical protein
MKMHGAMIGSPAGPGMRDLPGILVIAETI